MNLTYSLDPLVEVLVRRDIRGQIGLKIFASVCKLNVHKIAINAVFMETGGATMHIQSHTEDELRNKINQLA